MNFLQQKVVMPLGHSTVTLVVVSEFISFAVTLHLSSAQTCRYVSVTLIPYDSEDLLFKSQTDYWGLCFVNTDCLLHMESRPWSKSS